MTTSRARRNATLALLLVCAWFPAAADAKNKATPSPVTGSSPPPPGAQKIDWLIQRISEAQKGIQTLSAHFRQEKEVALLEGVQKSSGTLYYRAPNRVLWEYVLPRPILMLIEDESLSTYYPDLARVDRANVGRYQKGVFKFLGADVSLATVRRYFKISLSEDQTAKPYFIELTPLTRRVKRRIQFMRMWVDKTSFLPVKIEYTEPDGDLTLYEFDGIKVNAELPADRFRLDLPAGVVIQDITFSPGKQK